MARIPFVRHRTVNQIVGKYRACRHPIEKTRWHAIWLLARTDVPRSPDQVADLVGLSGVTVRAVLHRWNADGPAGLTDQRASNGAAPKLTPRRRQALFAAVQKRPRTAGCGPGRRSPGTWPTGGTSPSIRRPGGGGWWPSGSPSRCSVRPTLAGGRRPDPPGCGENLRRRSRLPRAGNRGRSAEVAEDEVGSAS